MCDLCRTLDPRPVVTSLTTQPTLNHEPAELPAPGVRAVELDGTSIRPNLLGMAKYQQGWWTVKRWVFNSETNGSTIKYVDKTGAPVKFAILMPHHEATELVKRIANSKGSAILHFVRPSYDKPAEGTIDLNNPKNLTKEIDAAALRSEEARASQPATKH